MKRMFVTGMALCFVFSMALSGIAGAAKSSEAIYKEHCAVCHPDGGNIINPKKTLSSKDLKANGIHTADDLVKVLRKPGPGMNAFDAKTIPDKDAKALAEYIMKKYK